MSFDVTVTRPDGTVTNHSPKRQTLRLLAEIQPLEDAVFTTTAKLNEARAILAATEDQVTEAAVGGDTAAAAVARDQQVEALRGFSAAQEEQLRARLALLGARLEPVATVEDLEGGFDIRDLERMEEALMRPTASGGNAPDGSMS